MRECGLRSEGRVPLSDKTDLVTRQLVIDEDRLPVSQFRPPYVAGNGNGNSRIDVLAVARGKQLVIDAKHTAAFSKGHLYQVLASMKMLDAAHGALVYPVGAEVPAMHFGYGSPLVMDPSL